MREPAGAKERVVVGVVILMIVLAVYGLQQLFK